MDPDDSDYDWEQEVEKFEKRKSGVKGLVDSGVTKVPRFFISPPEAEVEVDAGEAVQVDDEIPVIDFEGIMERGRRGEIVEEVRRASERWGFFQMVNHGVPARAMEGILESTRRFHEQAEEEKAAVHSSDGRESVRFYTINGKLSREDVGSWRDAFSCNFTDGLLPPNSNIPDICRDEILEYMKHMKKVRDVLSELLSEALGGSGRKDLLEEMQCMNSEYLTCLYYPTSPEPEKTMGTVKHSDPTTLTVLLQDATGGLQIHHNRRWVDVPPIPGALIANIGDFLQLMSNDKLISVEHRVLARSKQQGIRVSSACFFYPSSDKLSSKDYYGPIKELLSQQNPPLYRQLSYMDFVTNHQKKNLRTDHSALANFKLINTSDHH